MEIQIVLFPRQYVAMMAFAMVSKSENINEVILHNQQIISQKKFKVNKHLHFIVQKTLTQGFMMVRKQTMGIGLFKCL